MSNRLFLSALLPSLLVMNVASAIEPAVPGVVLGIHGGIGMDKKDMTPEMDRLLRADLESALKAGYAALKQSGASGLDAVEAAVRVLEESPHFNAGKGAVFTHDGRNELDASIMEGRSRRAGAVGGVTTVRHPIAAARAVMEKSKHVLLIGPGAESFAVKVGLEIVDPSYFRTERRWKQHQEDLRRDAEREKKSGALEPRSAQPNATQPWSTVGAVALDSAGNLAAGTSTGGMSNKMFGRVGDSPIIGAGTYADNEACAVSGTGHGEYFIRLAVAYDIGALMKYKGLSVAEAAAEVVLGKLKAAGGEGGVIALDAQGNFAMPYNTEGMYRGYVTSDGQSKVLLYKN